MSKVYLAGPISGLTYDHAQDWREEATLLLACCGIQGYSPLRAKEFLRAEGELGSEDRRVEVMATDRGIMTRDHYDCMTSDVILCNLLGASRVSVGTVMEIAWAFAYRKPLVVVMEPSGNLHDHPMIREAIGYHVSDLGEAVAVVRAILQPN